MNIQSWTDFGPSGIFASVLIVMLAWDTVLVAAVAMAAGDQLKVRLLS
jgi:hypothetical protein